MHRIKSTRDSGRKFNGVHYPISKPIVKLATKAIKTSKANLIKNLEEKNKELTEAYIILQAKLNDEKEEHLSSRAEITALKSENALKGGLRMKKLREEVEDLKEQLETSEAQAGRLRLQLRDERTMREKRDGTTGFFQFYKNDPEKWMSGIGSTNAGSGGGGSKRRRDEDRGGGRAEREEVVDEDLLDRKKKENEAWSVRRGQLDRDDEEVPSARMIFKMEKKLKVRATASPIITNVSGDAMDIDDDLVI